jgi:inosose dehydratase
MKSRCGNSRGRRDDLEIPLTAPPILLLHDKDKADRSIDSVLAIAESAKRVGTRIIVTNPSPIRWGGPENKDDAQLRVQAAALDKLGAALKAMGLASSCHNHAEIECCGARVEFVPHPGV